MQYTQEAIASQRNIYRASVAGLPSYALADIGEIDMNWPIVLKNLRRQADALAYFGAYCNKLVDLDIQRIVMAGNHVGGQW